MYRFPLLSLIFLPSAAFAQKVLDVAQRAAEKTDPIVIVQAVNTQWVESVTLIICTLITAVLAPISIMWARKQFSVKG